MQRTLLLVSMIALAAAPAAAQGKSREHRNNGQFRTSDVRSSGNRASDDNRGRYRSDDEDDDRDDDRDGGNHGRADRTANRSKSDRTYIDSRGLECREKTQIKKDGRRSSMTKCREPKHGRGNANARRTGNVNQCTYLDSRCDQLPSTGGNYPQSRRVPTTDRQPTMSEILAAIAARQQQQR